MKKINLKKMILGIVCLGFIVSLIIMDFTIIPEIYGEDVSFLRWLITDPRKIFSVLVDPNAVLPGIESIVGKLMPLFLLIWMIGFFFVLFFFGRQFQISSNVGSVKTTLSARKPYLIIQDVSNNLRRFNQYKDNKNLDSLSYSVKCLEEKLSVESDFGYGNEKVINCEDKIYQRLKRLSHAVSDMENADFDANFHIAKAAAEDINSLLKKRNELKKY